MKTEDQQPTKAERAIKILKQTCKMIKQYIKLEVNL